VKRTLSGLEKKLLIEIFAMYLSRKVIN